MENIVAIVRGENDLDKIRCFNEVVEKSRFAEIIIEAWERSHKSKEKFKVIIKANMMCWLKKESLESLATDVPSVERLVEIIRELGFSNITVCEAQMVGATLLKGHDVINVARLAGYDPKGENETVRYELIDLSVKPINFTYLYWKKSRTGEWKTKKWRHKVGKRWRDADFRISFAKCKTHPHDFMTLGIKNIYGCFPSKWKALKYHYWREIEDVTARMVRNFPVSFSFVDAWIASDGECGHNEPSPRNLRTFFGGRDILAVDWIIFERAGLDPRRSQFLQQAFQQLHEGKPLQKPEYTVIEDTRLLFSQLCEWKNVDPKIIEKRDKLEEIPFLPWITWNFRLVSKFYNKRLFPPRNFLLRMVLLFLKSRTARFLSKTFKSIKKLFS